MALSPETIRPLVDALDEPALIVEGEQTLAANTAALALLGQSIEGKDIRLAIRHPEALQLILSGKAADLELAGIGGSDRPWTLTTRTVGN